MSKRRSIIPLLVTLAIFFSASASAQRPDPWANLRFLLGTWEARTAGGTSGADSSGTYTFRMELNDHVLARHSAGGTCKGPTDFNCDHGDLLYIYAESPGAPLTAIYWDNEGHTIHYDVKTVSPGSVLFLSPATQSGPQYQLIYERKNSVMEGRFQIRMPGQPFQTYLEWSGAQPR